MTARLAATLGAFFGGFGVFLGAFGAHALKRVLSPEDLAIFETAVRYQMYHAFALLAAAWLISQGALTAGYAARAFTLGIVLFSGSLYLLVFSGHRWLGAITPIGGAAFLAGWAFLFFAARRL